MVVEIKIRRNELNIMAKEYNIKYTGKKMDQLCGELKKQGAPIKCKVLLKIHQKQK